MGDVATFEAEVSLLKKIDIKQEEKNSKETIESFIEKYKTKLKLKHIDYYDIKETDNIIGVNIIEQYTKEDLIDIMFDKPMTYKEFVDNKVFTTNPKFKSFVEGDTMDDHDEFEFKFIFGASEKQLRNSLEYINLDILSKEIDKRGAIHYNRILRNNLSNKTSITNLSYCHIYCGSDNSASTTFTITQEFIDSLEPGDKFELYGNGSGSNC